MRSGRSRYWAVAIYLSGRRQRRRTCIATIPEEKEEEKEEEVEEGKGKSEMIKEASCGKTKNAAGCVKVPMLDSCWLKLLTLGVYLV